MNSELKTEKIISTQTRFLIVPSVEIVDEHCPLCISGPKNVESFYYGLSRNPLDICRLLRLENSKTLLIISKDQDFENKKDYFHNLLIDIVKETKISIQFQANFNNTEQVEEFIEQHLGMRIIINGLLLSNSQEVENLIEKVGQSFICFSLTFNNNVISFNGKDYTNLELMKKIADMGVKRVIYQELSFKEIIDFDYIAKLATETGLNITISNMIDSTDNLLKANEYKDKGIDSAVIGLPLYMNNFPCQQLWRLGESC